MADGPVLQRSAARALAAGTTLPRILELVAKLRSESAQPIILFGYYNPFFRYGVERIAADAAAAGADGFPCVDLPPEEAGDLRAAARGAGLDLIALPAPTTPVARLRTIVCAASGVLYFVSLPGGTGARAIWAKCPSCGEINYKKRVERRLSVCPRCGHHLRLTVEQRLLITVDRGSFRERDAEVGAADPLGFRDRRPYAERLAAVRRETGRKEAVVTGTARIGGHAVALGVFDFAFLGGSMGSGVGERLTRLIEHAAPKRLPLVVVSASGGGRMQG